MMELLLSYHYHFFFTFFPCLFLMIQIYKMNTCKAKCPPGPWKLPLLGNLHQLAIGPLHHTLSYLAKKHGPIMHLQLGEVSTIVISSSEAAKEVLQTHGPIFADRPRIVFAKMFSYNFINIVTCPYGDYWRQLRKICTMELLSAKCVRSYRSVREEEIENLIKSISSSPGVPINLTEKISSVTNDITCRAAFGKKCKDKDVFVSTVKEGAKVAADIYVPDVFPSFKFLHPISKVKIRHLEDIKHRADKFLNNIVDNHIINGKSEMSFDGEYGEEHGNLVDVLFRIQRGSHLQFSIGRDNIKAIILDIFSAGTETSSATIEWAMSEMIKNPRVMEKAQAEIRSISKEKGKIDELDIQQMNYLKSVIKETLRLHPPVPLSVPREARESCKVSGYNISAKTMVIVNLWAIGRDSKIWTNPERFEPERFHGSPIDFKGTNFELIPFGAGKRVCPGISFGTANIELSLAQLLYNFDWKLPNGINIEDFDMTEDPGFTTTRRTALHLIAIPYYSK